jgi:hypothetical protein
MNITLDILEDTNFFNDDTYEKYSVKDLHKICDYYGIIKITKYKKMELINLIMSFEEDDNNYYIVSKRKIMWTFMEELNNDNKMKKYISWN